VIARSVLLMLNSITITSLYVLDQDQALDFYVGKLGFEVTADMPFGPMRWLTIALPGQPDRAVLLERPGPPSMSEETAAQLRELITKGVGGGHLFFQCDDAWKTHAELKARGVEVTEEPVDRGYGIDFGLRDPFGNHVRVAQMKQG
jgi:catechol 2,3-dioxygenase-like lactoylglutathione lyase family enzyme